MKSLKKLSPVVLTLIAMSVSGCGKEAATGGVTLQSNPLAGSNQAYYRTPMERMLAKTGNFLENAFGIQNAFAAVSSFNTFKVCVSEVVWELQSGSAGSSSTAPLKPGLLDFSPTSTAAMTIGKLDLADGTVLKNIKFTIATNPTLCGTNYAVLFNAGSSGDRQVTQDMSFRFDFASGYTVSAAQPITVYLGNIVNGMAALGASLDNSTIQNVNVGQAQ